MPKNQVEQLKGILQTVFGSLLFLYLLAQPKVTLAQISSLKPFRNVNALVVGIADYKDEKIADLPFADDDAVYFAKMLQEQSAWSVAPNDIVLLTNEEATYGHFIAELNTLIENAQPRDRIIIFFAGHGDVEVVSAASTGYLLFHDAARNAYAAGGACEVNTLDLAISRLINEKNAQVILIVDACHAGTMDQGRLVGAKATAAVISGLFSNTAKLLSCKPDESSLEDPNLAGGHGLFSYFLVQGMLGAANANNDPYVDLYELQRYLEDEVRNVSNGLQTPSISGPTSLKIMKARRDNPAINSQLGDLVKNGQLRNAPSSNSSATTNFLAFSQAVSSKHLLVPYPGSAYAIYENMGDKPDEIAFRQIMKTTLISELQADAQRSINEYLTSPGKELARRRVDSEIYDYYPSYLENAAKLLGENDYFYADVLARGHYFRGVNLRLSGELIKQDSTLFNQAMQEQEKALQLLGKSAAPHIYNEIGLIHQRLDRIDEAIAAFRIAQEQSPRWGLALSNLAFALKLNENYPDAEKYYQLAIQENSNLSLPYYNLAILYEQMDSTNAAIAAYEQAITRPNPIPEAFYNLSDYYNDGDSVSLATCEKLVLEYLNLVPDDIYGYLKLSGIYRNQGELDKAREMCQLALALDSTDFYVLDFNAALESNMDNYDKAIEFWEKALLIDPDRQEVGIWIAKEFMRSGEPEKAIQRLKTLLKSGYQNYEMINPSENFHDLLGRPKFKQLMQDYFPKKEE